MVNALGSPQILEMILGTSYPVFGFFVSFAFTGRIHVDELGNVIPPLQLTSIAPALPEFVLHVRTNSIHRWDTMMAFTSLKNIGKGTPSPRYWLLWP